MSKIQELMSGYEAKGYSKKRATIELGMHVNELISSGKTCKEVADELELSESQVRSLKYTFDKEG